MICVQSRPNLYRAGVNFMGHRLSSEGPTRAECRRALVRAMTNALRKRA